MGVTLTDVLLFGKAQSDDVDNATLVIYRRNILRWSALGGYLDIIVKGVAPLSLPDAIANSLSYVKAFGGTEQRNLPDNYIERQFIYMMDDSYIRVEDLPISAGYKVEFDFQTTSLSTALRNYLGGRASGVSAGGGFRLSKLTSSNNNRVVLYGFEEGTEYYDPTTQFQANTRYKYTYNNGVCTLESGGNVVSTRTFTVTDNTSTDWGINTYTSGTVASDGIYVYSLKVWNDQGELVMDLVPAVQKGTVPVVGFYDTVTGGFRTATSGTFAAGGEAVPTPDAPMDIVSNNGVLKARHQSGLPLGYTLLEYIKKTSLAYIDSGINQTDSVGISIDVKFDSYNTGTSYQYALGAYSSGAYIGIWKMDNSTVSLCFVNSIVSVSSSDNTNFHNFKINYLNSRKFSYDDSNVDNINQTKSATSPSIYIGDTNYAQHFGDSSFSIKRVRISNETAIVFDGIPAKTTINGTEVVGLYDTVSGTFKTAKAGTFTAGSPVSDPVEIYTDGTVETIGMIAGNIISDDIANANVNSAGKVVSSAKVLHIAPVVPGETYTCDSVGTIAYFTDIPVIGSVSYDGSRVNTTNPTFTVPNDPTIKYVAFSNDTATSYCVQGSVLYSGGTATVEMLLKVGDYQDEFILEN